MANTNRITISLSNFEYEALLALSKKQDRSLAWLGRRAIVQLINKHSEPIVFDKPKPKNYSMEKSNAQ